MAMLPRISVVTSSFNQGRFLSRTIESVLAQNYSNLEHIVVDGMSTDNSVDVLAKHPHLRVVREPDRGQADAINKGFRLASGDIFCFLNSDDILMPGALHRVAREIDPARNRHIVVGRCIYIDADDRPTGMEHPCSYQGHLRVLQAWRRHTIPQPATFWTANVWRQLGPLDESEHLVLDYDLFCRFSRHYPFHVIDQVLAGYRLHDASKTCTNQTYRVYRECLRISRRYRGSLFAKKQWLLLLDHLRAHCSFRARQLCRLGWRWRREKHNARAALAGLAGAMLAPREAIRLRNSSRAYESWSDPALDPDTLSWRCFDQIHPDGCIGTDTKLTVQLSDGQKWLRLCLSPAFDRQTMFPKIEVRISGEIVAPIVRRLFDQQWLFVPVSHLSPGRLSLDLRAQFFLVPQDYLGNGDLRPLTFRLTFLGDDSPSFDSSAGLPARAIAYSGADHVAA